MASFAERTAVQLYNYGRYLKTTLVHKGQVFNHSHLATVAAFMNKNHIRVVVNKEVFKSLNIVATYVHEDIKDKDGLKVEGNTLYLSDIPESLPSILIHEAVHIYADIYGKSEFIWDHEELAFFVEGFVVAQVLPKSELGSLVYMQEMFLGFFASEFYNVNPYVGAVSSQNFNKKISFDFTKSGGTKGKINPYQTLTRLVKNWYPNGKQKGVLKKRNFGGVF